ncbi:MAG: hypothetical protein MRERV_1c048 [Mycoplasmataceae bacterium RV_VA103A]|nr:MAG: hypothetical protein MRERV_10c065 [Mycoplasmataceae bacterium RV_VA103A]KLL05376.1 MAG: hypothetical protein MRERV_1c048 [Mycoplasmataceae bacterium RV_VA103A]
MEGEEKGSLWSQKLRRQYLTANQRTNLKTLI